MELRYLTPLSPAEQMAAGLDEAQPLALADRVRYGELDVLNHVNNKAYMDWFETLRTEHFFRLCTPFYARMPQPRTVLRNAEIHYVSEMVAGQSYIATARVSAFRNTSYTIEQMIWSDGLRARMVGVMVMLNPDGSGKYALPDGLKRYFEQTEGATQVG
jgi:acyl-CoA thioester hydrolase